MAETTQQKSVTGLSGSGQEKKRPEKHHVRKHNPDDYSGNSNAIVKTFDSETQARNYIKQNHPRGREVFYHSPADGTRQHYSADLDAQSENPWTDYSEDEEYS